MDMNLKANLWYFFSSKNDPQKYSSSTIGSSQLWGFLLGSMEKLQQKPWGNSKTNWNPLPFLGFQNLWVRGFPFATSPRPWPNHLSFQAAEGGKEELEELEEKLDSNVHSFMFYLDFSFFISGVFGIYCGLSMWFKFVEYQIFRLSRLWVFFCLGSNRIKWVMVSTFRETKNHHLARRDDPIFANRYILVLVGIFWFFQLQWGNSITPTTSNNYSPEV